MRLRAHDPDRIRIRLIESGCRGRPPPTAPTARNSNRSWQIPPCGSPPLALPGAPPFGPAHRETRHRGRISTGESQSVHGMLSGTNFRRPSGGSTAMMLAEPAPAVTHNPGLWEAAEQDEQRGGPPRPRLGGSPQSPASGNTRGHLRLLEAGRLDTQGPPLLRERSENWVGFP